VRKEPLILIVEDNPASLDIMQVRLTANKYQVVTATDGEEGLAMAQTHHPDLILLDIMMPKMGGLEVCRRIKNDPKLPFMPIIMVTAKADSKDVIAGLEAGGDEYLTKPVDHGSLVARVKSMLRIKELHDTVLEQSSQLKNQLKTASVIQKLFWPELPNLGGGVHIWAASHPASYVGGDFYDVITLPDTSIIAYVADVSGKGVPAALIMAALSMKIRTEALLQQDINSLLQAVNTGMYNLASEEGYFVTLVLLRFWPIEGKIELVRAGHPNPVWIADGVFKQIPPLKGVSLGIVTDVEYEKTELWLGSGDSLLLFSDGVIEAENEARELFGDDRLIDYIDSAKGSPRGLELLEVIGKWRGEAEVNDDLTLLEIWYDR
jgi:sigma-B regulation protein RsbU (phosphoserine phosphatase)